MGEEPLAKSFKSGNSVAIRIPASVGVEAGKRFAIRRTAEGTLVLDEVNDKPRKLDLSKFWATGDGSVRLKVPEDRVFEERELLNRASDSSS